MNKTALTRISHQASATNLGGKCGLMLAALLLMCVTAQAADPPPAATPPPAVDNQAAVPRPSPDIKEDPVQAPESVTKAAQAADPPPEAAPPPAAPAPVEPPSSAPAAAPVPAAAPESAAAPAPSPAAAPAPAATPDSGTAPAAAPPPAPLSEPAPAPAAEGLEPKKPPVFISMDFTDVDLPVLIKFISEQTRKNFIFDERVQGKITIISPRKITVDDAYNVFLSVLQVKGFTTVEQGNTIKIIHTRDAKQDSLPTARMGEPAGASEFITRLIPLQYTDTTEIVPVLTPLISKDGLLTSFPASNMLILIDSRSNIDRVMKILAEIDIDGTSGTPPSRT